MIHGAEPPGTGLRHAISSSIFYANDEQKRIALAYIDQLNQAKVFSQAIVTQVVALKAFYRRRPTTRTTRCIIRMSLISR